MRLLNWVLTACLLTGCGSFPAHAAARPPLIQGSISRPVQLGADTVRVMPGSPATFAVISSLLQSATRTIDLEMYEFGRADLRADLIAAHGRGVRVSVIADPTVDVTLITSAVLRAAGIAVRDYPVRPEMIDHVKLLIVDDRVAVIGGVNWGDASAANHDFDVEVTGPAVRNLLHVFEADLAGVGEPIGVAPPVPDPNISVLSTLPTGEIGTAAVSLIESATRSIELDLYVLTSTAVVNALERAHARGIAIHLLLDPSERPSDPAAAELSADGIEVRIYRSAGELLHAKAVVVDEKSVLFGSANWSAGGFERNHEVDLEIDDSPQVAAGFLGQMRSDWAASAG